MKLRLASLILLTALAQSALAADPVSMGPTTCPDASTLAAVKLDTFMSENNSWIGINYDTKLAGSSLDWSVGTGFATAASSAEAAVKLQNILSSVSYVSGPEQGISDSDNQPMWACEYTAQDGTFVEAVTPKQIFNDLIPTSGSSLFKTLQKPGHK